MADFGNRKLNWTISNYYIIDRHDKEETIIVQKNV